MKVFAEKKNLLKKILQAINWATYNINFTKAKIIL